MEKETKAKKLTRNRIILLEKYQQQAIELLDKYFPKGSKKRGEAIAILAVAFYDGRNYGKEES